MKQFKPTDRCRRLYSHIDGYEGLPAKWIVDEATARRHTACDDKMQLEPIEIQEKLDEKSVWKAQGYVCPWCGVYMTESIWVGRDGRCPFCHIRSRRR